VISSRDLFGFRFFIGIEIDCFLGKSFGAPLLLLSCFAALCFTRWEN
jgi:hypothetical protein